MQQGPHIFWSKFLRNSLCLSGGNHSPASRVQERDDERNNFKLNATLRPTESVLICKTMIVVMAAQ